MADARRSVAVALLAAEGHAEPQNVTTSSGDDIAWGQFTQGANVPAPASTVLAALRRTESRWREPPYLQDVDLRADGARVTYAVHASPVHYGVYLYFAEWDGDTLVVLTPFAAAMPKEDQLPFGFLTVSLSEALVATSDALKGVILDKDQTAHVLSQAPSLALYDAAALLDESVTVPAPPRKKRFGIF